MHRTLPRNLDQLVGERSIDATLNADDAFETINLAGPTLRSFAAIFAVFGRQLPYLTLTVRRPSESCMCSA